MKSGLGMAGSYYAATAAPTTARAPLQGALSVDLCVIGGGCTGLAAALFAAERGYKVALLEAGRLGCGASGRNGGQIIPGLRQGPLALVKRFGAPTARQLFTLAVSARTLVADLIRTHAIDCDLVLEGHLHVWAQSRQQDAAKADAECAAALLDYPYFSLLSRRELAAELDSDAYCGGLLDSRGGHFHPLNYALGLAAAAARAGVSLFENSPVLGLRHDTKVVARTAAGSVTARYGVLACDALLGRLQDSLASRIIAITSHIVATIPLPAEMALIPRNRAISDSQVSVNYFRMTADRRLLFGGGERIWPFAATDIAALVRKPLARVFPQLAKVEIAQAWGGLVAITRNRLPDIGRIGPLFYAQGYSGQGAILSSLAGKLMADAMAGTAEQFDLMGRLAPQPFPGGRTLRTPLHLLGMLCSALRDRMGMGDG